jgi:hypothetical protein
VCSLSAAVLWCACEDGNLEGVKTFMDTVTTQDERTAMLNRVSVDSVSFSIASAYTSANSNA